MMKARVVRFGEISERLISGTTNLSREERESLWFTGKEMRKFRRQAERTTTTDNKEDDDCCCNNNNDSVRISTARWNQRRHYIRYVLRIQSYNKSSGIEDPTGLGAVAVALSKNAMEHAHFRGARAAAEVEKEQQQQEQEQQQQNHLYSTETESDAKRPGFQSKRSHVSINAPKRNRTAANMA